MVCLNKKLIAQINRGKSPVFPCEKMDKKPISNLKMRHRVHRKYKGHCAYCGNKLRYKDMQVDHMTSQHNHGSDEFDNLMPSCRRCNHYKRAYNLKGFRYYMKGLHERIKKNYINKVALDYGIIKLEPFDGVFYFEKYTKKELRNDV